MPAIEESSLRVAHLDADAFYVSIELSRHPELRGKPVVVSGSGPRAAVTTASYEARRYGVGSAMPAARARRQSPQAVLRPSAVRTYRRAWAPGMGLGPRQAPRGRSTVAAVAAGPEETLIARFGPRLGPALHRRARFESGAEVGAARKVVSESRERTFDRDLRDERELRDALARMAGELCKSLSAHQRHGRTIGIKVRLDDFTTVTRARTLPEPTADAATVTEVALLLLADYAPPRPVRLLG